MEFKFCNIKERDMDLLFLELFAFERGFVGMLIDKTDISKENGFSVENVELWRANRDGESDITCILKIGDKRYGFLIENKIAARPQLKQAERYRKRGEEGKTRCEYDEYRTFIFCPERYYDLYKDGIQDKNNPYIGYDYCLLYEECQKYLEGKNDLLSQKMYQQLSQAINASKSPSKTETNEAAVKFKNRYKEIQKKYYPLLDNRTSDSEYVNGYRMRFRTNFDPAVIEHRIREGRVDFFFISAAEEFVLLKHAAKWLNANGFPNVVAEKLGDSSLALKIDVCPLGAKENFDNISDDDIKECLEAVNTLNELADFLASMVKILDKSKRG